MSIRQTHDDFTSSDERVVAVRRGEIFATHFKQDMSVTAMREYGAWQRELVGPDGPVVSFSLILGAQRLPADVADATSRYIKEFASQTRASATVISATGFAASAARAMASTFYLVSRLPFPRKVFATVAEAEQWLAEYASSRDQLQRAADWLRLLEALGTTGDASSPIS